MTDPRFRPGAYEPPFTLRRPATMDDFNRMEEHQRYWASGTRIHQPMIVSDLSCPPANSASAQPLPFDTLTYGRGELIHPLAKAWCFFVLEDRHRNIIGIFYGAGLTETARRRLFDPAGDELPLDDHDWRERYVLDPARPDLFRHCCVAILTDWRKPHFCEPLLDACYKLGELLNMQTLCAQFIHIRPDEDPEFMREFGMTCLRTSLAKTPEQTPVSVWTWERDRAQPLIHRQYVWQLEALPEQVGELARFYQKLGRTQREELIYLVHHFSIQARAERFHLSRRTVDERRRKIREALEDEISKRGGMGGLRALGIDPDRASLNELGSFLGQYPVAQALTRIAWFYGELPAGLSPLPFASPAASVTLR